MTKTIFMDIQSDIPHFQFPTIPKLETRPFKVCNAVDYADPKIQKLIEYDQLDSKTKNRLTARKWREGRKDYLNNLEETNFLLRTKSLSLLDHRTRLMSENKALEEEIQLDKLVLEKIQELKK